MAKRKKQVATPSELPPAPTGDELHDIIWATLTPWAEPLMSQVEPDPQEHAAATAMELVQAHVQIGRLRESLTNTRSGRIVTRLRKRQVEVFERELALNSVRLCATLGAQVRAEWPDAQPGQHWVVVRDRVRALLGDACLTVLSTAEFDGAALLSAADAHS